MKSIKKLISKVNTILKPKLLNILDKGGVTVVLSDEASVITVIDK
jgi:hypothetical protein